MKTSALYSMMFATDTTKDVINLITVIFF